MDKVNIHDAKTHLSRLVERVEAGESIVIARAGRPVAKIVPLAKGDTDNACRIGFMAGEIAVPDDFDRMGEEDILALFSVRT